MQRSKSLISQALSTLKGNMERTGDPLGFKKDYWTGWTEGLNLPREGETVLLTARMYQMLPYVIQATEMVASAKPILPLLSLKAFAKMFEKAGSVAGETVLRLKAKGAREVKHKGENALKGIAAALNGANEFPAYHYEAEPYSGVLLYDLGLEKHIAPHVKKVYQQLKSSGVKRVITVDPHTTFMLREVFPGYISHYDLEVVHYLELLFGKVEDLKTAAAQKLPKEFVMHDSCVMTRDLGIVEQARQVASGLGITLIEPENAGQDTACCGGPVEYAYADLSGKISNIRIQELAARGRNILVTCPICLINLMKYEKQMGIKVWDMGELLFTACKGK
ncbi:MAG: (Fe-S)-binding protein [Thermodesulfobacteriota bacterium]|nr:(Fe-S)-binding protein [Thermodesulfobacteriota bacterium]